MQAERVRDGLMSKDAFMKMFHIKDKRCNKILFQQNCVPQQLHKAKPKYQMTGEVI